MTAPRLPPLSCAERAEAVTKFDRLYGEMERAVWCLSKHSRESLLEHRSSPVVAELVWTVKTWMGVQFVPTSARPLIAQAVADLDWSAELFEAPVHLGPDLVEFAVDRVVGLVERSRQYGVGRREVSLSSKVLHWLLPWRIPVYDNFVRESLAVPELPNQLEAYRYVAEQVISVALAAQREECDWLGSNEPQSPLRGIDKCLWWFGGGDAGRAMIVKDPWVGVRRLGLDPSADC